jgi:hypothetical protein
VKKIIIRTVLFVVAAFGIVYLGFVVSLFIPRHGTARSISDLQKVYSKGGPQIAATFTNSLIQKFPFDGPIDWRLIFVKEPELFLTGKVDTNALHQFINDHTNITFLWAAAGNEFEEGWPDSREYPTTTWTNLYFKGDWTVEGFNAQIRGNVDLRSRVVMLRCSGGDEPVSINK